MLEHPAKPDRRRVTGTFHRNYMRVQVRELSAVLSGPVTAELGVPAVKDPNVGTERTLVDARAGTNANLGQVRLNFLQNGAIPPPERQTT